jgi:hypothetical protein
MLLRSAGYFLDLWHWRAQRSNPIGMSDDQFVAEARFGDAGKSGYSTNWDGDAEATAMMFDPATGRLPGAALGRCGRQGRMGFRTWSTICVTSRRCRSIPMPTGRKATRCRGVSCANQGSRADIAVSGEGRWADGYWDVTLSRAMDTGNPLDDKIFATREATRGVRHPSRCHRRALALCLAAVLLGLGP